MNAKDKKIVKKFIEDTKEVEVLFLQEDNTPKMGKEVREIREGLIRTRVAIYDYLAKKNIDLE